MPLPANILDAARRHFTEHFGRPGHHFVHTATDRHPGTGRPIYLVAAVSATAPNERPVELILDEGAHHVELPNERRSLFVPDIVPVPSEIVEAVKVQIDPPVNNLRLGECDTVRETITVTIPASSAVAPADIYFLADNTGSMTPAIAAVQAGASAILGGLALPGLQFGVGAYRDFINPGDAGSIVFLNQQAITNNAAAVTTAIGSWSAARRRRWSGSTALRSRPSRPAARGVNRLACWCQAHRCMVR